LKSISGFGQIKFPEIRTMNNLDWLWGAIVGAIVGAALTGAGFLFNQFVLRPREERRQVREREEAALKELDFLLTVSKDTFSNQNFKARRLLQLLEENHSQIELVDETGKSLGFDEIFHRAYNGFTQAEKELFDLIRGSTQSALRDANERMLAWIHKNPQFLQKDRVTEPRRQFADCLYRLQSHLSQWSAKYAGWIPENKTRSLVYLRDEKGHGEEFPRDIEVALRNVLYEMHGRDR
jgi:hypothetical protein